MGRLFYDVDKEPPIVRKFKVGDYVKWDEMDDVIGRVLHYTDVGRFHAVRVDPEAQYEFDGHESEYCLVPNYQRTTPIRDSERLRGLE